MIRRFTYLIIMTFCGPWDGWFILNHVFAIRHNLFWGGGGVSWWVMRRAEGGMGRAAASLKLMEVWEERSLCCMPVSVPMAMPTQRARRAGANKVALPLSHLGWACRIVTTPLFVRGAVCSYLRQRSKEIKRRLLSLEDCVFNLS